MLDAVKQGHRICAMKDDEIAKLEKKKEQIENRLQLERNRRRAAARKLETRAKVIIGALAISKLPADQLADLASKADERDYKALKSFLGDKLPD